MRKVFMGLLVALLLATSSFAEVNIPKNKRVCNLSSGVCVWCAIENLGNVHGIKQLNGITKYRHDNYGNKKTWVEGSYMIDALGRLVQIEGPHWSISNEAPGTPKNVQEELIR